MKAHLKTRAPALRLRIVKIMQNVFVAGCFNMHFKNKNIMQTYPVKIAQNVFIVLALLCRSKPQGESPGFPMKAEHHFGGTLSAARKTGFSQIAYGCTVQ